MDIWDWIKGLRTWWWMIVVFPLLAASITWIVTPEPQYETRWSVNIYFDDPDLASNPAYFDFILLDDLALLIESGTLGDMIYLRLPEDVQASLTRQEFGGMVDSARRARFVEITVSGDDQGLVSLVAESINTNLEEVTNFYLIPPTYRGGAATVNLMDPIQPPELNERSRLITVGSVTVSTAILSVAATGVAEWLRLSYRAKYSAR